MECDCRYGYSASSHSRLVCKSSHASLEADASCTDADVEVCLLLERRTLMIFFVWKSLRGRPLRAIEGTIVVWFEVEVDGAEIVAGGRWIAPNRGRRILRVGVDSAPPALDAEGPGAAAVIEAFEVAGGGVVGPTLFGDGVFASLWPALRLLPVPVEVVLGFKIDKGVSGSSESSLDGS